MRHITRLLGSLTLAAGIMLSVHGTASANERDGRLIIKSKQELKLTTEQEQEIREIMKRYKEQAAKDREAYKDNRNELMKAGRERNKKMDGEIDAVLSAEQRARLTELREARKQRQMERREEIKADKQELKADDKAARKEMKKQAKSE